MSAAVAISSPPGPLRRRASGRWLRCRGTSRTPSNAASQRRAMMPCYAGKTSKVANDRRSRSWGSRESAPDACWSLTNPSSVDRRLQHACPRSVAHRRAHAPAPTNGKGCGAAVRTDGSGASRCWAQSAHAPSAAGRQWRVSNAESQGYRNRLAEPAGLRPRLRAVAGVEQLTKRLRSRQAGAAGARNPHGPLVHCGSCAPSAPT